MDKVEFTKRQYEYIIASSFFMGFVCGATLVLLTWTGLL